MFDLQGHRGARGLFPENTLEGFRAGIGLGLRCFELDVGTTRDGIPVVQHDPALNPDTTRDPSGNWVEERVPLRDLTLAELQRFDVGRLNPGNRYATLYPTQVPHDGARIPTLDSVLRLDPSIRYNIELKLLPDHPEWTVSAEEMTERVLHVIEAAGAADRVTVQSFDWRVPRHVRRLRPDIPRGWLTMPESLDDAALWRGVPASNAIEDVPDAIAAEGGGTWTSHHTELTQALLARGQALGLLVIPWTVNRPEDMRRLIGWGVDGLITDWPDRALPLLP